MLRRRILSAALICCILAGMLHFLPAGEATASTVAAYAQKLVLYYRYYQEDAGVEIHELLADLEKLDPDEGAKWKRIMIDWSWCNTEMQVKPDVLPDGLPEDDSLCIVVLGYELYPHGSMKPELVDRLEVALASAKKYPQAYIAVTGGGTAACANVTEAGAMAKWLIEQGIDQKRIIIENHSINTTGNAQNTYKLLEESYPEINSIAIVTSDYHITWGSVLFQAASDCAEAEGKRPIRVIASACCATETTLDTIASQACGICDIAGIPYAGGKPELRSDGK